MAENLTQIDTIEAYLRGKLDGNELDKFEKQIEADPNFKNEVEFQQSIKDGLLEVRRLELKQRLNNIIIEPAFEWTLGKIAAGVAMVGLLGFGVNYLMGADEVAIETTHPKTIENIIIKDKNNIVVSSAPKIQKNKTAILALPKENKKVKTSRPVTEEVIPNIDFHTPSIPVEHGHHHVEKHADGTTPNGKIEQVGAISISSLSVDIEKNADKFHYKYFSDKLVLVGDFSKGPYELIELNKNQEKNLYLYYDGAFYELHYGTENMDHLVKISQNKLIKELKFKIKK